MTSFLVMISFEEMNQPLKIFPSCDAAQEVITAADEIISNVAVDYPKNQRFSETGWPEEFRDSQHALCAILPELDRQQLLPALIRMHLEITPHSFFRIVEVDDARD